MQAPPTPPRFGALHLWLPGAACRRRQGTPLRRQACRPLSCQAVAQPRLTAMGAQRRGGRSGRGGGLSGSATANSSSEASSRSVLTPVEQQQQQKGGRTDGKEQQTERQQGSSVAAASPLLPIAFIDGRVTVGDGTLLLDRVSPQARVQHPESQATDRVLLSLAASQGHTAIEDFALGVVSRPAGG